MKNILISFSLLLFCSSIFSQQYINFHTDTATNSYLINESDSLYFDESQNILYFNNEGDILQYEVSGLDSLTFTTDESNNIYIDFQGTTTSVTNPLSSSGVTVNTDGGYVTINSTADIKDINYICTGTTTSGSLKVYSDKRLNLLFSGINITNPVGPAINIQSKKKATIHLAAGTDNILTDGSTYDDPPTVDGEEEDQKATFFSEAKLNFIGGGNLTINSNGDDQHALRSDDEVLVLQGNITITSSEKDGIHASDGFFMYGGELNITSTGDGIDGDENVVEINGGNIIINSTSDDVKGIACDSTMTINGGEITLNISGDQSKGLKSKQEIILSGGTITGAASGAAVLESADSGYDPSYCSLIKCDGDLSLNGATLDFKTTGIASRGISCDGNLAFESGSVSIVSSGNGSTYTNTEGEKDAYHGACIKVDGDFHINGGDLSLSNSGSGGKGISCDGGIIMGDGNTIPETDITTTGSSITITSGGGGRPGSSEGEYDESKSIKADGYVTVNSGILTISSADDGIKAGDSITINNGTITIEKSVEGIEAPYITFNDGITTVNSSDDCLNATFGNGGESNDGSILKINGGTVYTYSTGGDNLDSNGNISVTGGTTVGHGPQSSVEVGMDVNGSALISGGLVIISGSNSNMTEGFSSSSEQYSLLLKSSQSISANTIIHLEDASGKELFTFKPVRNYYSLIFSSPDLAQSTTYKLYTGGSSSGTETNGLITGGTYTSGTLKKTFTISNKFTTLSF